MEARRTLLQNKGTPVWQIFNDLGTFYRIHYRHKGWANDDKQSPRFPINILFAIIQSTLIKKNVKVLQMAGSAELLL